MSNDLVSRARRIAVRVATLSLVPTAFSSQACAQDDPAASIDLEGSCWQIAEIQSMDDKTYRPIDGQSPALTFLSNQQILLEDACGAVRGRWASAQQGELQLSLQATDKPVEKLDCGDDGFSGRLRTQFPWVRSYVYRDERLFLATMADGAIIELLSAVPLDEDSTADQLHLQRVYRDRRPANDDG